MANDEIQVVLFSLNGVLYGADVHQVREVREVKEVTPVPYAPPYVEGVTNLRGEVIPVIDLKKRFNITEDKESKNKIMLVVHGEDKKVIGVLVDSVMEVMSISQSDIERTPDILSMSNSNYILGVAKRGEDLIILLDLRRIVSKKSMSLESQQFEDVMEGDMEAAKILKKAVET
ncbi:MAG: chemotaxis protein CheW [archaeon GB-1867-005]|nr:chemotaxis protein CheW [Candidatus Culexmicrobium cathedralense]